MSLSAHDIENQVFREKFRGYDPEEVDRFLDRVSERISALERERDEAVRRAEEASQVTAEAAESERLLKRTLLTAERTAEETVANARAEADQLLERARQEAQELVEGARQEAETVREEARREADELRGDARREAAHERELARTGAEGVRRAVSELRQFREEYRERVRGVIAEQLAVLDRVGDLPELPPAIAELAHLRADDEPSGDEQAPGGYPTATTET